MALATPAPQERREQAPWTVMGDLFKALGSGLAQYVYAWLMPSIVTSGVFFLVVLPQLGAQVEVTGIGTIGVFALGVFSLSTVFAYTSRPLYQFLEGYTMPGWLARRLLRRTRRRYVRLVARTRRGAQPRRHFAAESLLAYPDSVGLLLPTRLGNALRAMESYGQSRFGLDSQTFWYEIQAVAEDRIRDQTQEARAAVDFFMSSIAHLMLLTCACVVLAPAADQAFVPLAVAAVCAALIPAAYSQAVRNVGEWRFSVQALVNTSRPALAEALSLTLPETYEQERDMWRNATALVVGGPRDAYLQALNPLRIAHGPTASPPAPPAP